MEPVIHSYTIQEVPPADPEKGETVRIGFFDRLGREVEVQRMHVVRPQEVFEAIDQQHPIDLDGVYIRGLDLERYREERELEPDTTVDIPSFSARGAFFDHHYKTDFSSARFQGDQVDFSGARFAHGELRFHKVRFPEGGLDMSRIGFGEGDLDFKFAVFQKGGLKLEEASFGNGSISFVNAEFGEGSVSLRGAWLGDGDLDFHFARFSSGHICFDGIYLGVGKLDLRKADFGDGRFDMRRAELGKGDVLFDESEFRKGKVNFRSTNFGEGNLSFRLSDLGEGDVIFDRASFGKGDISFRKATVEKLSFRDCHIDHYMDLRVARAECIDLSDTVVRGLIDLIPTGSMELEVLYLTRMRSLGQLFIDWEENRVKRLIEGQTDTGNGEKADQYRILKEEFTNTGQYDSEDRAYVMFKRHERKALARTHLEKSRMNAFWVYPSTAFQWLVFDKMGKYATDPLRVLVSMLTVYTLFSIAYIVLPPFFETGIESTVGEQPDVGPVAIGFYHSAITFLTIGYGDFHPTGFFRWISGVEGFFGIFLTAYFTVAFVRKILR